MKKSTVLCSSIITMNTLAMIVAIAYQDLFNVICFGLTIMGMLVYYMEIK